jgi:hypothetical protein
VPIRAEPCTVARELVLPESVARELRTLLKQDDGGTLSEGAIRKIKQQLQATERPDEARDSNDDKVARVGECEIVADGGLLLDVILDGLAVRLVHQLDGDEKLRFTGER